MLQSMLDDFDTIPWSFADDTTLSTLHFHSVIPALNEPPDEPILIDVTHHGSGTDQKEDRVRSASNVKSPLIM